MIACWNDNIVDMLDSIKTFTKINVPGYFHFLKKVATRKFKMTSVICIPFRVDMRCCVFLLRQSLSVFVVWVSKGPYTYLPVQSFLLSQVNLKIKKGLPFWCALQPGQFWAKDRAKNGSHASSSGFGWLAGVHPAVPTRSGDTDIWHPRHGHAALGTWALQKKWWTPGNHISFVCLYVA